MENKVVLVTGSSRGIGRATIIEFAKKGYNVVINYIDSEKEAKLKFIDGNFEFNNEEDAKKLKEYVEKQYEIQAMIVEMDVSNEAEIKNGIKKIIDRFGKIDVLVNCAGIVFDRDIYKATVSEFENTIRVNILGAFIVSREVSKYMGKGSSIINVSSTNGTKVIAPESIDYNISKVGLQSLTRDLAFQFKPDIRVNAIAPGMIDTDMNKDIPEQDKQDFIQEIPLEKIGKTEDISKCIEWLIEDNYTTGQIISINGGIVI